MSATAEVGATINAIQTGTSQNITETDKVADVVIGCSSQAETAGVSLAEIVTLSNSSSEQIHGIASASEEQSATSNEIVKSTEEMLGLSTAAEEAMTESVQACRDLTSIAQELDEVINDLSSTD